VVVNVLHVSQGYEPAIGGTERTIQRLSEELVRQFGDEVAVFTTNCLGGDGFYDPRQPVLPAGWDDINGVRVRRFTVARHWGWATRAMVHILRRLRIRAPEKLHAFADGPIVPGLERSILDFPADLIGASSFPLLHMFVAQRAALRSFRPCIFYGALHPEDTEQFQRPMIYRAIQAADHYVAYTQYEADYVIQKGADPQRVSVIGLGVDPDPFLVTPGDEARLRLRLSGFPVVGYIGQLVPHKGVDALIKAMPLVWQRLPEAHLLIAGAKRPFTAHLETMISAWPHEFRSKTQIIYNFDLEDKPWLYAALDVFAYPSALESFGTAFFEAWAAGKPVIACRKGAIPEVVKDGEDGILVDYGNEAMLAEAIFLLLTNHDLSSRLGEVGKQKTLSNFTWPIVARRFQDLFAQVIVRHKSQHDRSYDHRSGVNE
jgi:glycosyltransferase involved in cell wall biosynthesis